MVVYSIPVHDKYKRLPQGGDSCEHKSLVLVVGVSWEEGKAMVTHTHQASITPTASPRLGYTQGNSEVSFNP